MSTDSLAYAQPELIIPTVTVPSEPVNVRRPVDLNNEDEVLIEQAIERMIQLMADGHGVTVAWSSGKDSSCVLVIVINAMMRMKEAGMHIPKSFLVTADTLIENPQVNSLKYEALQELIDFTEKEGLPLEAHVSYPSVMNTFQVQVIGGQTLPTYANSVSRQCSVDLKITPNKRKLAEISKSLPPEEAERLTTLLGSRMDESTVRAKNIQKQQGSSTQITTDRKGKHFFYPIVDFTQDTVWWCLARAGKESGKTWWSYSNNHDALADLYRESAGGECVVFQPDVKEDDGITREGASACGARHGCFGCQAVDSDRSMDALVALPENAWMKPLHTIREYIATLRYDWTKRRVGSRTINDEGYVKLDPNTLNYKTCRKLLKACMTADRDEKLRALVLQMKLDKGLVEDSVYNRRMSKPQFQIITDEILLGIQWNWSVLGMEHKPFSALKVWQEVYQDYDSLKLPEHPAPVKRTSVPKSRWLYVGADWYQGDFEHGGLYDALGEIVSRDELDACKLSTRMTVKRGSKENPEFVSKQVPLYDESTAFEIDEESAAFFMMYEADRMIEMHHNSGTLPAMTASVFMRMGIVSLPFSKRSVYDKMLARATYLRSKGLHGDLTYAEAEARGLGTSKDMQKQSKRRVINRQRREAMKRTQCNTMTA